MAERVEIPPAPTVYCPKDGEQVPIWYCMGSLTQGRERCPYVVKATIHGGESAEVECNGRAETSMALLNLTEQDLNRLWGKLLKGPGENDCWGWADVLSEDGYAYLGVGGREGGKFLVHRLLYELRIGPIPDGKELDHLCRNRWCVRPDHQEPVTRRINLLRGKTITARNAAATHCIHGHPFDEANTHWYKGHRQCRRCSILGRARRIKARKEYAK